MLKGRVEVPHLAGAQEDQYGAWFKDVDFGIAWRCRVISEVQGPIYLSLRWQK